MAGVTEDVNSDNINKAEELKSQANEYFKTEKYPQAIEIYTQCIKLNPNNAVYYANRSIAYLRYIYIFVICVVVWWGG